MNDENKTGGMIPTDKVADIPEGFFRPELEGEDIAANVVNGKESLSKLKFKLEITSELETFFLISGIWFVSIAIVLFFLVFIDDPKINSVNYYLKLSGSISVLLTLISAVLYYATDNYYIIDDSAKKIMFNFKFFGYLKTTPVIDFIDIYAITATGVIVRDLILYRIIAITENAAVIVLSELEKPDKLDELNRKAGALAAVAGCLYAECPANGFIYIDHIDGEIKTVKFIIR